MIKRYSAMVGAAFLLSFVAGAVSVDVARELIDRQQGRDELPSPFGDLELDSAQMAHVQRVFASYQPRADTLLLQLIPQIAALADSIDAEVLPVLNPEQREKLKRMQRPATYLLKRKSRTGVRVDTLHTR